MEIQKILFLSTSHMKPADAQPDSDVVKLHSCGSSYYMVMFSTTPNKALPDYLEEIKKLAVANDCAYIAFDMDADVIDSLTVFDWV